VCTVMTRTCSCGMHGISGKLTKRINFGDTKFWCAGRNVAERHWNWRVTRPCAGRSVIAPFAVQGRSLRVSKALTLLIRLLLLAESALLNRKEKSEANDGLPAIVAY